MRKQKQKQIRFEVPAAMHARLKSEAAKRETTLSALMRSQIVELPIFKPKRIAKRPVRQLIKQTTGGGEPNDRPPDRQRKIHTTVEGQNERPAKGGKKQ